MTDDLAAVARTLTPDELGRIMFDDETIESIARVDKAQRRLRKRAAGAIDIGQCSHGWVAAVKVQKGRAHVEYLTHGAPTPLDAVEDLLAQIDDHADPRYEA